MAQRLRISVDAGFILLLCLVALYGFHQTFNGPLYLLAGGLGVVFGIALAWLADRLNQPVIVLVVFAVAAFFLLGGAVSAPASVGHALPVPSTLRTLADESIHGWKELVTTVPPIDSGPLLALPYLLGLIAGAGGMALATRLKSSWVPALAPIALLSAVIALGVAGAPKVALLAGVFGVLVLAWTVVRSKRNERKVQLTSSTWRRRLTAFAMCAVALGLAFALAPNLPGVGDRFVLRNRVTPPFDIGQYPSPLASFRRFTAGYQKQDGHQTTELYDQPLLKVTGVPAGSLMPFAALDDYNGLVWGAVNGSASSGPQADSFQKVGSVIDNPQAGTKVSASVQVLSGYTKDGAPSVWLPAVGGLTSIRFANRPSDSDPLRYNLATDTGVVPGGLSTGETYRFTSVVASNPNLDPSQSAWPDALTVQGGAAFRALATQWGSGSTPVQRVLGIANYLKTQGKFADGTPGQEQFRPGHSLSRLDQMIDPKQQLAGDDEQYAALLAVLGNQLGVPTRAVFGAEIPQGGQVTGKDVHAWVQVRTSDGVWRNIPPDTFLPSAVPDNETPAPSPLAPATVIPPPNSAHPTAHLGESIPDEFAHNGGHWWDITIPGWLIWIVKYLVVPVGVVAAILWLMLWAKRRRTTYRRTNGEPVKRIALAWRELVDLARDRGHRVTAGQTRREQAVALGLDGFHQMARGADAHVFGAGHPSEEHAHAFWAEVDRLRAELNAPLKRWKRWAFALNPLSFLPPPGEKLRLKESALIALEDFRATKFGGWLERVIRALWQRVAPWWRRFVDALPLDRLSSLRLVRGRS